MTDLPDSTDDQAANSSTPDGETPAGDPELAALVDPTAGDAKPEAGVDATEPVVEATPAVAESTSPDPDAAQDDATTVDVVPVVPLAAAVTDGKPPSRPRRRRSLLLRFGVSFVLGFLLVAGVGVGALYAWGAQYEGRVLPGVSVGSTNVGGLTRDQAAAEIESAYEWLGDGQITLTGPDGDVTTISYADVGRGPDTSALLDAALAAGRQGEPLANLIDGPQVATNGMTLDSAVAYDRDQLAAAVETLATAIHQTPTNAAVSGGQGVTFDISPAKEGRAVEQEDLLAALDQQLTALETPASITMDVPVVTLTPAVATTSAETARAAAARMAADLVVARGEETWKIAGSSLAPLIRFLTAGDRDHHPVFDESGLDPMLKTLAKQVNQKVRNAGPQAGRRTHRRHARQPRGPNAHRGRHEGRDTMNEIASRQAGAAASPVAAVVKAVDPKLTTEDAKAFAPEDADE